ncbi:MAG: hypothetical protein JW751_22895 [Polyangiaceae bacterium]|nr:hypothetical protein [Polyangiaceae bacterium]
MIRHRDNPSTPDPKTEAHDEGRSEVRYCAARRPTPSMVPSAQATLDRGVRIDAKIEQARIVLEELDPSDPRIRLLRLALIRRDEVLLDGLLAGIAEERARSSQVGQRVPSVPPTSRR